MLSIATKVPAYLHWALGETQAYLLCYSCSITIAHSVEHLKSRVRSLLSFSQRNCTQIL